MHLTPDPATNTFGRSGFLIHSDRRDYLTNPHAASSGCIILPPDARFDIAKSKDPFLEVV
jgi:hypothetical protein